MNKEIKINRITDSSLKQKISDYILRDLPEWFGIESSREKYVAETENQEFFAAEYEGFFVGFLSLKKTSDYVVEVAVTGVLKKYRGNGIGTLLFNCAKAYAKEKGFEYVQVKTVSEGKYKEYDETNAFYKSLGFKEFEEIPSLWSENNPCQIYVMSL